MPALELPYLRLQERRKLTPQLDDYVLQHRPLLSWAGDDRPIAHLRQTVIYPIYLSTDRSSTGSSSPAVFERLRKHPTQGHMCYVRTAVDRSDLRLPPGDIGWAMSCLQRSRDRSGLENLLL